MMIAARLCLVAALAAVPASFYPSHSAQGPERTLGPAVEELIAEKAPACAASDDEDAATRDGSKVAWRCAVDRQSTVLLNGVKQGGAYDDVRDLVFSPDGRHLAFAARRDKRWFVVLDGAEAPATYDDVRRPVFGPDSRRLLYAAKRNQRWVFVEDGKEGTATYADVGLPLFSRDGGHICFHAKAAKKWILVADGVPGANEFDGIVFRTFSPDGRRVGYVGRRGNNFIAVVDGKEGPPFDIIGGFAFSADGSRFSYGGAIVHQGFGKQKATGRAVVDGVAGPEFEGAQVGSLLKTMATNTTVAIVVGYFNELLADTHGITAPVFSADGKRVAYGVRRDKDSGQIFVDAAEGATFPRIIAGPVFRPDGQHLALVVAKEKTMSLLVDGKPVGAALERDADFVADIMFSPNGERVGFVGVNGGDWYERGYTTRAKRRVYIDGAGGAVYDAQFLGRLQFTPDSRHVLYIVGHVSESSRNVSFVVADSVEGKRYDDIFGYLQMSPDGRSVSYVAQTGRRFYAVRQPLD